MKNSWRALKLFAWMTFITGIAYPLLITGIAQLMMGEKANGHFLEENGKLVGANLIGQKFESEKYFWSRPSAIDYNPLPSGGSNLGPTSERLRKTVEERKEHILKFQHDKSVKIPSEFLYASGSGLDPHISYAGAQFQIDRIVHARKWDADVGRENVNKIIDKHAKRRKFIFFGHYYLNVLKLNLALDELDLKNKLEQ